MQLDTNTMLVLFLVFLVAYQVYSMFSMRNKIFCTFRRIDRTKIEKWAKKDQRRIEFDGGWYDIDPSRVVLMIKWMPLPTWVRSLDFRHDSSRALSPDTFENQYTPEQRKQLDRSDDLRALEEGSQTTFLGKAGKKGLLETWTPVIMLIGFLIIGYMMWKQQQSMDMLGAGQNYMESQLGQLQQLLGQ